MQKEAMHVKAVVFQMEGILIEPPAPDTLTIKSPTPAHDSAELIGYLHSKNIRLAMFSHDSFTTVKKRLEKMPGIRISDFDMIICREQMPVDIPEVNLAALAAKKLKLPVGQVLAVITDPLILQQVRNAGAISVFLNPVPHFDQARIESDFYISNLTELKHIARQGIPLPPGKLPNDLLREYLNQFVFDDSSILINPGVGEDTAAIDVVTEEVLVLKSDPITFATDSIGQYAVLINANDIATSGAIPRWLLTTLLFPCGVTPYEIRNVINELKMFCRQWDITLCGGHTEITDAVTRPVVTGMMAGTVARRDLIDKRNIAPGDRILMTKGVAVEGTAIIAREFGVRLKNLGMTDSEIESSRQFLANISVITEARLAAESGMVSAMHDVTEGGLANAVEELSIAGGYQIQVDLDSIPIFTETRRVCSLLRIDPLGLIGSGSLLICCRNASCKSLITSIQDAGIDVTCIGQVLKKGQGVIALKKGRPAIWPQFEADEIARLF
jgi:hydrogenase maturation factor